MPEISLIVPVYKAEAFLRDCVDGILAQTFADFELLLVDDGSPDGSLAICREYEAADSRVRVFHQENQGQSAARNFALTQAQGQWICYVDSDDLAHPQLLELLYQAARESGAPISMCGSVAAQTPPAEFFRPQEGCYAQKTVDEDLLVSLFDRGEYPSWVVWGKLIRRELVQGYPFCPGRIYEDNEAVCRWVCRAGKLAVLPAQLYFYRTNPDSTTQKTFSLKRLDYLWALESIIRFYSDLGYSRMTERFCGLYAEAAAGYYRRVAGELGMPEAAKNIEKAAVGLFFREKMPLKKEQFEMLLDAMHPKLIRYYWPLEGAARTLRQQGLGGLVKKLAKRLGKGDRV